MSKLGYKIAIAVAGGMLGLLPAGAFAATIVNGSFETSTDPDQGPRYAGDTSITGWRIGAHGVDYISDYWIASDGTHSLDLSASNEGSITQTIATVLGQSYAVDFDLAGNPDGTIKHLEVSATGNPTLGYMFDTAGHDTTSMGWTTERYAFTATGAFTDLTFTSLDDSVAGPALDNVRLEGGSATPAVPEPASWAMMVIGFGAVGGVLRRQQDATRFA